jgi:hypothetical protein
MRILPTRTHRRCFRHSVKRERAMDALLSLGIQRCSARARSETEKSSRRLACDYSLAFQNPFAPAVLAAKIRDFRSPGVALLAYEER